MLEAEQTPVKNFNGTIGNWTHNLPACSALPQLRHRVPKQKGKKYSYKILVYNSNKMHKWQSLFYLSTALHVSGVTITHLQEHKTTVTTASGNRYTVLFSAAIVEELKFQLFRDSSRQQYDVTVTRCCSYSCFVLLKMGDGDARNV